MDKLTTKNLIRLLEASDKEGKEWRVCIIEEGPSKNSAGGLPIYYTAEALKKAAPLFEDLKVCIYEFSDKILRHLPDTVQDKMGDKFPKNIVGQLSNVHFGKFKDSEDKTCRGLLANLHITENASWLRQLMKDAWERGKKLLGFSINGKGSMSPTKILGRMYNAVKEISQAFSVEVVTHPAAAASGKQVLSLMACANETELEDNEMEYLKKLLEMLAAKSPDAVEGIDQEKITEEQEIDLLEAAFNADEEGTLKILAEAEKLMPLLAKLAVAVKGNPKALALVKQMQDAIKKYPKAGYKSPTKAADDDKAKADADAKAKADADKAKADADAKAKADADKSNADKAKESADTAVKAKEDVLKINCKALLDGTLSNSKLPVPVQEDIKERFKDRIFEAKELETAINKQMDILAKLSESGEIQNLGKTSVEVTLEESDKKQAALDMTIDPEAKVDDKLKGVGSFRGIKEAYVSITGDTDISGVLPRSRLSESITVSDFPKMLEYSINRAAVRMYPSWPSTWRSIADTIPVRDYKSFDLVKWGGFGKLPVVASKGTYQDLQQASEETITVAGVQKRGGLVIVPEEAFRNDDLRFMQRIPRELVQAAAEGLDEDIWTPILTNAVIYDLETLGNGARGNYATTALDYASLSAAKQRMRKQRKRKSYQVAGTALGSHSTTTLQDTTKSWGVNAYAGYYVRMTYSDGAGQMLLIASNTSNELTFAAGVAPIDGTKYEISAAQTLDPRMGLELNLLAVGADLKENALVLRNSERRPGGANNDVNIHRGTFEVISPRTLVSATNWFGFGDKKLVPIITVTFLDGKEIPSILLQDQPNVGQVFTNDQIRYKVKFAYNYAVEEYRNVDVNMA